MNRNSSWQITSLEQDSVNQQIKKKNFHFVNFIFKVETLKDSVDYNHIRSNEQAKVS